MSLRVGNGQERHIDRSVYDTSPCALNVVRQLSTLPAVKPNKSMFSLFIARGKIGLKMRKTEFTIGEDLLVRYIIR